MWDIPFIKEKAPEVHGEINICYHPENCEGFVNNRREMKATYVARTNVADLTDAISKKFADVLDTEVDQGFSVKRLTSVEINIVLRGKEGVSYEEFKKRAENVLKKCKGKFVNEFSGGYECCEKVIEDPSVQYFKPGDAYGPSKDNASDTDGPVNFELSDSVIANASDAKRSVDSNASSMDNFNNYDASDMDSSARLDESYMNNSSGNFEGFDSEAANPNEIQTED